MPNQDQFVVATRRQQKGKVPNAYDALKALPEFSSIEVTSGRNPDRVQVSSPELVMLEVERGLGSNYIVERRIPHHIP